ncbi:hypothetical protein OH76DRAFT_1557716 [Lentinus brumalis]|uniref:Uncharacterized protein n=1 Tax=Lentinus brumalis TaxID=2498619 RepID=A0A371D4S3_9APHY|nr:hypothetical protein OH76DRAFT_1557716 [Polyporus brumalis]
MHYVAAVTEVRGPPGTERDPSTTCWYCSLLLLLATRPVRPRRRYDDTAHPPRRSRRLAARPPHSQGEDLLMLTCSVLSSSGRMEILKTRERLLTSVTSPIPCIVPCDILSITMHPEMISETRRTVRVEQGPSTYTWTVTDTVTHAATGQYRPPTPLNRLAATLDSFQAGHDIFETPPRTSDTCANEHCSACLGHAAPQLYPLLLPSVEDGHYDPTQRDAISTHQYISSPEPPIVYGAQPAIFVPVAGENDRGPMRAGTPWHSPPRHSPSSSSQPYPSIADDWRAEAVEPRHRQSFSAPPGEPFLPPPGWVPYPEMPSRSEDRQSHCQPGYGASTHSGSHSYHSYQTQPSVSLDSGYRTASAGEDTPTPYSGSTSTSWVPLDGAGYSDPTLPRARPGSPAVGCLSTGEVLPSDSLPLPPPHSDRYMPERYWPDWGRRDEQWPWPEGTSGARQEYEYRDGDVAQVWRLSM